MSIQYFEIGTTYAGRVNVETLSTTPNMAPAARYFTYADVVPTGENGAYGRGSAIIEWHWDGFIPSDMFVALRAICTGASASVYIRSRTERGAPTTSTDYTYYTAKMIWPDEKSYEYRDGKYTGFILTFHNPVVYTP